MKTPLQCPTCGNPIPADAPEGHCPLCLVHHALEAGSLASENKPAEPTAASPQGTIRLSLGNGAGSSPGARIHYVGDYEILEEIARGGMGVVYKARQTSLDRIVAVKMILAGRLADEAQVRRFHAEAEAAANLQHPNIIAIHEVGEEQGQHYFSMDYVDGPNLAEWAKTHAISPAEAARLVFTLARAVQYAHTRGTLHRDLKPHNVVIDQAGNPRITDFGLAKALAREAHLTQEGLVMGSPSYMPPEQAKGRLDLIGPASDVYALGAILYELLAGRPPFGPGPSAAVLRAVIDEPPTPPTPPHGVIPSDLETICLKCLEKDRQRRYATAGDLADDLERFLNREPILARPASPLRKAWAWLGRHPWVLVATATALLLVLAGFAYALWEQSRFLAWKLANTGVPQPSQADGLLGLAALLYLMLTGLSAYAYVKLEILKKRGVVLGWETLWVPGTLAAFQLLLTCLFAMSDIHDRVWNAPLELAGKAAFVVQALMASSWQLGGGVVGALLLFTVLRELRLRSFGLRPEAGTGQPGAALPSSVVAEITNRDRFWMSCAASLVLAWFLALNWLNVYGFLAASLSAFLVHFWAVLPVLCAMRGATSSAERKGYLIRLAFTPLAVAMLLSMPTIAPQAFAGPPGEYYKALLIAVLDGVAVGLLWTVAVAFQARAASALAGSNVEIWGSKSRQVNLWEERALGFGLLGLGGLVTGWHSHHCICTGLVLLGLAGVLVALPLQVRAWMQATGYERRRRRWIVALMAAILITELLYFKGASSLKELFLMQ